ncbi:MAG: ATP-binding protein [Longimicrobiaceae bacterium]
MPDGPALTPHGTRTAWVARVAMLLIVLSLATLIVVPVLVQRRVVPLRAQVEQAERGRTLVGLVEFQLALEMSSLRGYLLSEDRSHRVAYDDALARENAIYPKLDSATRGLPSEVAAHVRELHSASARWHREADDDEIVRRRRDTPALQISTEQAQFEAALRAAASVDSALVRVSAERREEIRKADQLRFAVTVGLVVLALASAAAATWFARRVRLLAEEARARHAEAERALADLRESNAARERMMRGVTHDLKNPLGAARGFVDLLREGIDGELSPGQARMAAGIRRNLDTALAIIHDLLDLARADAGTLEVARERTDCRALLHEAVDDHRAAAAAAGHALELRAPDAPVEALADPLRVRQVMGNLLSNAIKYTPPGGRVVAVAGPADNGDGPRPGRWVQVTVEDSGPGIAPEHREGVFREFERLDPAAAEGHGLGLAIGRRVARLLGGDVTVGDSELGGAAFTLWLPAAPQD